MSIKEITGDEIIYYYENIADKCVAGKWSEYEKIISAKHFNWMWELGKNYGRDYIMNLGCILEAIRHINKIGDKGIYYEDIKRH